MATRITISNKPVVLFVNPRTSETILARDIRKGL
jgi:hypothetical protein